MMLAVLLADYHNQYSMYIWIYGHGFAFHSLQAFPLLALFSDTKSFKSYKKLINSVGAIWIIIMASLDLQTYLGESLFQGPLFFVNLILIVVYLSLLVLSIKTFKQNNSNVTVIPQKRMEIDS